MERWCLVFGMTTLAQCQQNTPWNSPPGALHTVLACRLAQSLFDSSSLPERKTCLFSILSKELGASFFSQDIFPPQGVETEPPVCQSNLRMFLRFLNILADNFKRRAGFTLLCHPMLFTSGRQQQSDSHWWWWWWCSNSCRSEYLHERQRHILWRMPPAASQLCLVRTRGTGTFLAFHCHGNSVSHQNQRIITFQLFWRSFSHLLKLVVRPAGFRKRSHVDVPVRFPSKLAEEGLRGGIYRVSHQWHFNSTQHAPELHGVQR